MEKIIEFLKTHKTKILIVLVIIFFFRSCGGSKDLRVLENKHKTEIETINAKNEIENDRSYNEGQIDAYNVIIDDVSKIDRPAVLMELHNKWINKRDEIKTSNEKLDK